MIASTIASAQEDVGAFQSPGDPLPPGDDSRHHVGYGIVVIMEAHTVRVGSKRFMEMDRYFAQVLPADNAEWVRNLQSEGGKVSHR
jgi:cation transport ATPase